MAKISDVFYRFNVQLLYALMIPFSFLVFVLIYRPFDLDEFLDMGRGLYAFNLVMLSCIILVTLLITRLILYFLRGHLQLSMGWYIFWCCMEVFVAAHFVTLYLWLMLQQTIPYLEVLGDSVYWLSFILVFPYVIIGLSLRLANKKVADEPDMKSRMRFLDVHGNLKLVAQAKNVLYIAAEENYVNITYIDKEKEKTYVLRNSMKNIEDMCERYGLLRCHRSYIINKEHVKSLRKDKDGYILAELDSVDKPHIPVSKKYYDTLAALL